MSVTMDYRLLTLGDYWLDQDDQKADPYFGLAAQIVYLIGEISCFNTAFTDAKSVISGASGNLPDKLTNARLPETAKSIETKFMGWGCHRMHHGSALAQLAETYHDAAFLHLSRTLRRHLILFETGLNRNIRKHLESICSALLIAQKYKLTRITTPAGTVGFGGSLFCIYAAE
jgi:hypothetical protein